jgi:hypothetical protein
MIKATDEDGKATLWFRALDRFGLPTIILAVAGYFVGWQLWPEHRLFLNRIATQQESQTSILGKQTDLLHELGDRTEEAAAAAGKSAQHAADIAAASARTNAELTELIRRDVDDTSETDLIKGIDAKVDRVHANTEEIKSRIPKADGG